MTYKFCHPKRPKSYGAKDEFPISIRVQDTTSRVYIATGKSCKPKDLTEHGFHSKALNDLLLPIREKIKAIGDSGEYTPAEIKSLYNEQAVGAKKLSYPEMVEGYFKTKNKLAVNSVRARRQVLLSLGASLKSRPLTPEAVQKYINSILDKHSTNTVAKYGKIVASFLNHYKIDHSLEYPAEVVNDTPYLKEAELHKLEKLKLTGLDERVRDAFLMMCYTGLRIGDLELLQPHNFVDDYIEFVQKKTKKVATPVLSKKALALFKRYGNAMPSKTNSVEINTRIKKLCVGIHPKASDIHCHTGRKTFAMGMVNKNVPVQVAATQVGDSVAQLLRSYYSKEHAIGREVMRQYLK